MTELTVRNLLDLFLEPRMLTISIWSHEANGTVFEGNIEDLPLEFASMTIESIDNPSDNALTINVE